MPGIGARYISTVIPYLISTKLYEVDLCFSSLLLDSADVLIWGYLSLNTDSK